MGARAEAQLRASAGQHESRGTGVWCRITRAWDAMACEHNPGVRARIQNASRNAVTWEHRDAGLQVARLGSNSAGGFAFAWKKVLLLLQEQLLKKGLTRMLGYKHPLDYVMGGDKMTKKEIECEIVEHIATIEEFSSGWTMEFNIVKWNKNPAKFDIRNWSPDHSKSSTGVALIESDLEAILKSFKDWKNKQEVYMAIIE